jgi:hypothetical protein
MASTLQKSHLINSIVSVSRTEIRAQARTPLIVSDLPGSPAIGWQQREFSEESAKIRGKSTIPSGTAAFKFVDRESQQDAVPGPPRLQPQTAAKQKLPRSKSSHMAAARRLRQKAGDARQLPV